jgi:tetratricopeptide (TPR) repeat protein/tRNA A-37 threonylcarbamoyl transferase component Bud32
MENEALLKAALADRYAIDREIGEGGMATVYLAEDLKHRRKVAIKVMAPELGATLGPERFLREIEISARLDHPHILPVYDSGEANGFLFFVMPYVEGESLRDRMEREGQLPIEDALTIAREVADALSYAHGRDVVHRDIKPANIMLAGGHARVADFGIARALSDAGRNRLTATGLSVGTPSYMSPEQAAGSPDLDGRSDLYSLGCVLYEMLGGSPPFTGPLESVVHQHLSAEPAPITNLRPAVPPHVTAVLMRALAKTPADRFSPAAEFAAALKPPTTAPLMPTVSRPVGLSIDPARVAGLFLLASIGLLAVVYVLVLSLGMPTWFLVGTVVVLLLWFPLVIAASLNEQRKEKAPGAAQGIQKLLTWRRAVLVGSVALVVLTLAAGGYTAARALGIGPAGTLIATGAIEERERIILADFENRTADPAHSATVTELMRIGLSQTRTVSVLDPIHLSRILQLMERDPAQGVTMQVALEAAEREGIRAVVAGEITSVGTGYSIAARLVSVEGEVLTSQQESAPDDDGIMAAADRLSLKLRERFGESLNSLRRAEPLQRVTTGSHRALRLFSVGLQAWNQGDNARAMQLLEEAIEEDSTFAMAHRKLAFILQNNLERRSRAVEAATNAYHYRDRLTERERYLVTAAYNSVVTGDRDQVMSAYRTLLDLYPDDNYALNNLGVIYSELRDYERAADYYARALAADSTTRLHYSNLAIALGNQRLFDSAATILDRFEGRFPGNPEVAITRIYQAVMQKDYVATEELGQALISAQRGTVFWEATAYEWMATLDAMRGRMDSAEGRWQRALELTAERGLLGQYLLRASRRAVTETLVWDDVSRGLRVLEDAVSRFSLEDLSPLDRPYGQLAMAYAAANDPERARLLLEEYEATPEADHSRLTELWAFGARGVEALVEGRPDEALANFRRFDEGNSCGTCAYPWLARAFEAAGQADSARAYFERFVDLPSANVWYDAGHLAHAYLRLGQICEEQGDPEQATSYLTAVLDLWADADPELEPRVEAARRALERLQGAEATATPGSS